MNYFLEDNSCVVDIETLATTFRSAVLSVAALKFNPNDVNFIPEVVDKRGTFTPDSTFDKFVCNINYFDNIKYNRDHTQKTIKFWSERSTQLQDMMDKYSTYPAEDAFKNLMNFLGNDDELMIWANPPRFDLGILQSYFEETGVKLWGHWRERCFRTAKGVSFIKHDERVKSIKEYYDNNGGLHDPLTDCKVQAGILQLTNLAFNELLNKA